MLAQSLWPIVAVTLEAFLFVGMSAPISQALIIYAEFTHVRPSQHFQPTVIALITGNYIYQFTFNCKLILHLELGLTKCNTQK